MDQVPQGRDREEAALCVTCIPFSEKGWPCPTCQKVNKIMEDQIDNEDENALEIPDAIEIMGYI